MKTLSKKTKLASYVLVIIVVILILILINLPIGVLLYFDLDYLIPLSISILSLFVSGIIFVHRKYKVSSVFIMLIIMGVGFLISGVIEIEFSKFPESKPSIENHLFHQETRPLRRGVPSVALSIALLTFGLMILNNNSHIKTNNNLSNKVGGVIAL